MKRQEKVAIIRQEIRELLEELSFAEIQPCHIRDEYDASVELLDEEQRCYFSFWYDEIDAVDWSRVDLSKLEDVAVDLCVDRHFDAEEGCDWATSAAFKWKTMDWTPLRNRRF